VPYQIDTVLTDKGQQFCHAHGNRSGPTARYRVHMFDRICRENGIEHRLTKPNHPWTNEQVERMHRTLKEAIIKRYRYESHDQLRLTSNSSMWGTGANLHFWSHRCTT
jgi:transposase InsO family protein